MSTITTRSIAIGTTVISAQYEGTFIYGGDRDGPFTRITFNLRAGTRAIESSLEDVAPAADTDPNLKDPRIKGMVTNTKTSPIEGRKRPYGAGYWLAANEELDFSSWHKTKGDAVNECARRLAIADWHSGKVS